ncbi:DNA adenine methylase [Flavobacterium sp. FlaQc-47]|uniref:DNA adenine methylase n=1 Tax=Flavobacterium sp. FlaQc-47 TaxID=3374180 RepID=UPI0037565D8D
MVNIEVDRITPFLRWTGSKRWFVNKYLNDFLPSNFNNYHEPFLGAGSVFFYLINSTGKPDRQFYLSDTNEDLINTYIQLRDNPESVIKYLKKFKNTSEYYYKIRDVNPRIKEKRAARFIYLNKTSFNGIFRVNSRGIYNVPYGKRKNVDFINENLLMNISQKLKNAIIKNESFEENLRNINEGDLVFIDPPYTVAHENNGFIEYNQKLFSWEDQERLKVYVENIIEKKAFYILTNASHISITNLYGAVGKIIKLSRNSQVGGRNKTRGVYNELIIHNTRP